MKHFFLSSMALIALAIHSIFAQPGSLDGDFDADGIVTTAFGTSDNSIHSLALQSDNKIITAGNSDSHFALARYNPDGSLDNTFDNDGMVTTSFGSFYDFIYDVKIQTDGKIIVVGESKDGADYNIALARYNIDGSLDNSFSFDGIVTTAIGTSDDGADGFDIQTDGKIVVTGYSKVGAFTDIAVVRYNSDGTLDNSFSEDGKLTTHFQVLDINLSSAARDIDIQPDGKIVIVGFTSSILGGKECVIIRYNADGTLDETFGSGGSGIVITGITVEDDMFNEVIIQSDEKIICAGYSNGESDNAFTLVRYNSDGIIDSSFSYDGKVITEIDGQPCLINSIAIQADGKYIAGGYSDNGADFDFALVRYNSDGTLDNTFNTDGIVTTPVGDDNDIIRSVAIQSNGRIIVGGMTSKAPLDYDFVLARYLSGLTLGVPEFTNDNSVFIYPNPLDQNSILEFILNAPVKLTLQLIDMQGKAIVTLINNQLLEAGEYKQPIVIPDNLPQGNYMLVMSSDKRNVSIKVIR